MNIIDGIKNNMGIIKKVAIAGGVLLGAAIVKNVLKEAAYPANENYFEPTTEETCSEPEAQDEE